MKLHKDLREFAQLLNSRGVEYLVVGGLAVAVHGFPRYTADADFFVDRSTDNARKIVEALTEFGLGGVGVTIDDLTQADQVIQLGYAPNRIDLLTSISGITFDEAWPHRVPLVVDGVLLQFIGREALLKNKRASGRARDLGDVDEIEKVAKKSGKK